jgi:hypothetical protein
LQLHHCGCGKGTFFWQATCEDQSILLGMESASQEDFSAPDAQPPPPLDSTAAADDEEVRTLITLLHERFASDIF